MACFTCVQLELFLESRAYPPLHSSCFAVVSHIQCFLSFINKAEQERQPVKLSEGWLVISTASKGNWVVCDVVHVVKRKVDFIGYLVFCFFQIYCFRCPTFGHRLCTAPCNRHRNFWEGVKAWIGIDHIPYLITCNSQQIIFPLDLFDSITCYSQQSAAPGNCQDVHWTRAMERRIVPFIHFIRKDIPAFLRKTIATSI